MKKFQGVYVHVLDERIVEEIGIELRVLRRFISCALLPRSRTTHARTSRRVNRGTCAHVEVSLVVQARNFIEDLMWQCPRGTPSTSETQDRLWPS